MIGRILGNRYELIRELGSGGMAWVYLADDLTAGSGSHARVAVKILYPQLAHDPDFLHRFLQEARLLVSLARDESRPVADPAAGPRAAGAGDGGEESPIVPVLDYGADRDTHYLVMGYVPGEDLGHVLDGQRPLEWRRALDIARQVACALDRADRHGVVHRDIKPGNIMLLPGDRVRVLDFGVARARTSPTLTHSGFVGSPYYVAPEQAMGRAVDVRADLYSLGVVLYEMLCGRLPFESDTPWVVVNHHISTPPPPPADVYPGLPASVSRLVLHALAKSPDDRFQTAGELMRAIDVVLAGGDPSAAWGAVTPAVTAAAAAPGVRPPAPFLDALYAQGQQAAARGAWTEAVDVFSQVLKFDARYRDVVERLAESGRQARLAALYGAAAEALEAGRRDEACLLLDEIHAASPSYRDVATLRAEFVARPPAGTPAGPRRTAGVPGRGRGVRRAVALVAAALLLVCAALVAWDVGGATLFPPPVQPAAAAPEVSPTPMAVARDATRPAGSTRASLAPSRPAVTLVVHTARPAASTAAVPAATRRPAVTDTPDPSPTVTAEPAATAALPGLPTDGHTPAHTPALPGGWIAFARFDAARRTYDVHACRPDGGDCHLLVTAASQPAYLPGAGALAVHSWRPDEKGLAVVDATGSGRLMWRITGQIEAARPAVDAAGRAVYHARDEGDRRPRLWLSDGGGTAPIRFQAAALTGRAPAWTPDGRVVYAGCAGDACGILIVAAGGGPPRQLVAGGAEAAPQVSPDGATLAFMSYRDGNWEVYVAPMVGAGAPPRRVTGHAANDGLPAWSPDGRWLAFVSDRGGAWCVWAVAMDGGLPAAPPVRLFPIGGPLDGQVEGAASHEVQGWVEERISWGE